MADHREVNNESILETADFHRLNQVAFSVLSDILKTKQTKQKTAALSVAPYRSSSSELLSAAAEGGVKELRDVQPRADTGQSRPEPLDAGQRRRGRRGEVRMMKRGLSTSAVLAPSLRYFIS